MRTYRQVTEVTPALAAFAAKHKDRLVSSEAPRGVWACEEDGEPVVLLLAYTEPTIRVSIIMDDRDDPPFMSLFRLADTFEAWAKDQGIHVYTVVVPENDDHYAQIIEKRGAVEMGRGGGWIEYLHEIDGKPTTADGIWPWSPKDWKQLRPLMRAFLDEHCKSGGDFLPTRNNVEAFIRRGVRSAASGDPCLIAIQNGKPIGFCLWTGIDVQGIDMREKVCQGLGTYIIPEERRKGWSQKIRSEAFEFAKRAGYARCDGVAIDKRGLAAGKAAGCKVAGILVRKRLEE